MDIIKNAPKTYTKFGAKKSIVILFCVSALLIVYTFYAQRESIDRNQIVIAKVIKGNLEVVVDGYGEIESNNKQLVTAQSDATIIEINLKAGDKVDKGTVIMKMENSLLAQRVNTAELELAQEMANLRKIQFNQKRELLEEESKISEIEASYRSLRFVRIAQESLEKTGIISKVQMMKQLVQEEQLEKRLSMHIDSLEQLKLLHKEAISIEHENVNQKKSQYESEKKLLDNLIVKANQEGIVQRLYVELGQSVSAGQKITLISSETDLVALLKISQSKVHLIKRGQSVIIDTRQDKIHGIVARIDPNVEENAVIVEIALPANLPASARLQLNVDGIIITNLLENILYIEKPDKVHENSSGILYKLDDAQKNGYLTEVQFGSVAGRYIQVLSGLNENEFVVVSSKDNFSAKKIKIRN